MGTEIDVHTLERGLIELAAANGNARLASRRLKADGISLGKSTLQQWRTKTHAQRYTEIREKAMPAIRAKAAEEHMELAESLMDVNRDLTERMRANAKDIPARDLPGAVRNVSTAAAIETDKAQVLNDQPTAIVGTQDATSILRQLKAKGFDFTLEPDAVNEEDVETPALTEG